MNVPSIIIVLFDGITRVQFFEKLEWPYLVKAWSKTISWKRLTPSKVQLQLSGIDELDTIIVTRKLRNNRIFIGARSGKGELIQSGVWEYDDKDGIGICYRRVFKSDLALILQERLADFCFSTFLKEG